MSERFVNRLCQAVIDIKYTFKSTFTVAGKNLEKLITIDEANTGTQ